MHKNHDNLLQQIAGSYISRWQENKGLHSGNERKVIKKTLAREAETQGKLY